MELEKQRESKICGKDHKYSPSLTKALIRAFGAKYALLTISSTLFFPILIFESMYEFLTVGV